MLCEEEQNPPLCSTFQTTEAPKECCSFPSDEGWPFAKYLGACGRMVAVNYVGEELWSFYNAPWEKRVDLAKQLMDIAEQLTNNDFDFALYLLDVSFDNFAVGPRDGKVLVIDAENVIVVDKRLIKQKPSVWFRFNSSVSVNTSVEAFAWKQMDMARSCPFDSGLVAVGMEQSSAQANKPENYDVWYESRDEECDKEACLSFSKDILCSRVTVDHNYYAVCQNLLSRFSSWRGSTGGLLHDPPADMVKDGRLIALLDECTRPQKPHGRFQAAKELREFLTQLTQMNNASR
ncbi:hypothetical protein DNTS_003562 [Danionella cerebrum]|uniref:FAM69 protein-kinase domain-containing protein n=1 Tax=Danionella cerebrum TaxID=2873325 RepID=A0A553NLU9_9TELE|nr:hypothetical protein DNTS_003562 [Danionella translucida]TRY66424.1 hypothetical protein DNTS_003562 [Danionella translucida]